MYFMYRAQFTHKKGFTLIELSIVMVVIGLVVGGIMAGKMLIQQAETRAAASQLQQLETSYRTFQTKYGCIIGDCPNATDLFGMNYTVVAAGCPPSGGAGNGNGNGDGFIDQSSGSMAGTWTCEPVQAAKSLQLSNLLPTSFKTPCASSNTYFKGINDSCAVFFKDDLYATIPASKTNAVTWLKYSSASQANAPALSPIEALSIDAKIDDGIPNKGKFRGLDASDGINPPTIAGSCSVAGVYNLNETSSCRSLYYIK